MRSPRLERRLIDCLRGRERTAYLRGRWRDQAVVCCLMGASIEYAGGDQAGLNFFSCATLHTEMRSSALGPGYQTPPKVNAASCLWAIPLQIRPPSHVLPLVRTVHK